jgi:hypothetical protein
MQKSSGWFATVSKLLAVLVVAALGAACATEAPTSPTVAAVSDEAAGSVAATALDPCADVAAVRLNGAPSPNGQVRVRASYIEKASPACRVRPVWASVPQGLVIATNDPFVVAIADSPSRRIVVTATAPNGRQGSIRVR